MIGVAPAPLATSPAVVDPSPMWPEKDPARALMITTGIACCVYGRRSRELEVTYAGLNETRLGRANTSCSVFKNSVVKFEADTSEDMMRNWTS